MYYEDELYHHGIKGMRWGHRKSRYESSSVSNGGKKSSRSKRETMSDAELNKRLKRLRLENEYDRLRSEKSDTMMKAKVNKLRLEREYKNLKKSEGRRYAEQLLKTSGQIIVQTAITGAVAYYGKKYLTKHLKGPDVEAVATAIFGKDK